MKLLAAHDLEDANVGDPCLLGDLAEAAPEAVRLTDRLVPRLVGLAAPERRLPDDCERTLVGHLARCDGVAESLHGLGRARVVKADANAECGRGVTEAVVGALLITDLLGGHGVPFVGVHAGNNTYRMAGCQA